METSWTYSIKKNSCNKQDCWI